MMIPLDPAGSSHAWSSRLVRRARLDWPSKKVLKTSSHGADPGINCWRRATKMSEAHKVSCHTRTSGFACPADTGAPACAAKKFTGALSLCLCVSTLRLTTRGAARAGGVHEVSAVRSSGARASADLHQVRI